MVERVTELNGGPALLAYVANSVISVLFRENGFANLNSSVPNTVGIVGNNNSLTGRVYEKTSRSRLGQKVAYFSGPNVATSSHMHDLDLRDNVTADNATLQTSGFVTRFNIRGNGNIVELPIGAVIQNQPSWPGTGNAVTIDLSLGNYFLIVATANTAFTISNPINSPSARVQFTIVISNTSGGALGAITPGTGYKLTGAAFPVPTNGNQYAVVFTGNSAGGYYETSRTGLVPN